MAKDNITPFPITHSERQKNALGPRKVACIVSGRLLSFGEEATPVAEGSAVMVDVLTAPEDDKPSRTLCTLALTKEDLQRALDAIKVKEGSPR